MEGSARIPPFVPACAHGWRNQNEPRLLAGGVGVHGLRLFRAAAHTATLGPTDIPRRRPLMVSSDQLGCMQPFTVAQRASSDLDVAPAAGVITSWRVNGREEGPLQLRVLEPSPGGWVGAGTSAPGPISAGGPNATEIEIGQGET